jgi:hypothetical protein
MHVTHQVVERLEFGPRGATVLSRKENGAGLAGAAGHAVVGRAARNVSDLVGQRHVLVQKFQKEKVTVNNSS